MIIGIALTHVHLSLTTLLHTHRQLFIFLHVIALLLMIIGIVLQEKVRRTEVSRDSITCAKQSFDLIKARHWN